MTASPSTYNAERGGAIFTVFLLCSFVGILAAGTFAFTLISHAAPWSPSFYEKDPPIIEWVQEPLGIGADQAPVKLKVSDSGAGLDEVLVRISQRNRPHELVKRKSGNETVRTQNIDLTIDAKALALREGKAELEVLAFDRTLWSNGTKVTLPLPVDFAKPRIDVITPQQNGVEGGVELVFYKVVGKRPDQQGVEQNSELYPGYPAALWNDSFKHYEDLYFSFYPIPIGFNDETHKMKLTARDTIGNLAIAPFNYRVKKRRFAAHTTPLDLARITSIATRLAAFIHKNGLKTSAPIEAQSAVSPSQVKELIATAKTFDEATLSDPWTSGDGKRYWSTSFGRPVTTLPSSTMGEERSIVYDGVALTSGHAPGVRFGVSTRQTVSSTNAGRVAFVGELGTYGTTVVLDHGFGLTTTYAHLSEASVKLGQEVPQGASIGRTGDTGLALSEEVYYETRLHGVPVSPNEWWDSTWIEDHIQKKVSFVQGTLIGNPGE